MRQAPITITTGDAARLRGLLAARSSTGRDHEHLEQLQEELERALVLEAEAAPPGVVAMHSRVLLLDLESGARHDVTLVYPVEADVSAGRISVLAPLGTALVGYREGDEIRWRMPGGLRRLRLEKVFAPGPLARPAHDPPAAPVAAAG